jgi:antitoxin VapB
LTHALFAYALDKVHTAVYTDVEVIKMQLTRVFNNGNSQAIRIPKEYRFDQEEVCINKVGSAIIIFPKKDRFSVLMESINEFTPDFLATGRSAQALPQERDSLD